MSRMITRLSRATVPTWFLALPSSGVVALLLVLLLPGVLSAQMMVGPGTASATPVKARSVVNGVVTGFDETTKVATLIGSPLLQVDLSSARIAMADADPSDATVPPIGPGAFLTAIVEAPDVAITIFPPPPLKALQATVRPPGFAFLRGEIESVGTDSFALLHRTILVDGNTVFGGGDGGHPIDGLSDLKPGMQAEVWVWAAGDALTAAKVVAHGRRVGPKPIFFRGVVKTIGPDSWTIGDVTVGVTPETRIVGDPQVGDTVDVIANVIDPPNPGMGMPSRLVAVSIVKVVVGPPPVPGRITTFDGPVQAMPPSGRNGHWKIADRIVTVSGLTKIEGDPKVGSEVTVTGYALPSPVALMGDSTASAMNPMAVPFMALSIKTKS